MTRPQIKRDLTLAHYSILSARYPGASVAWLRFNARKKADVQMGANRGRIAEALLKDESVVQHLRDSVKNYQEGRVLSGEEFLQRREDAISGKVLSANETT